MGKLNIIISIILIPFFFSCNSQTSNMKDNSDSLKLESKLMEIALSYVKKLRKENKSNEQLYIYIEKGNDKKTNYYKYTFYNSGILNENLNLPYKYVNKQSEENFSLFFFDEQKKTSKNLKENLIKDSLWVSSSNIDKFKNHKPVIKLSHNPVLDVFICKENIQKLEIIESAYGMEEKDKVTGICD